MKGLNLEMELDSLLLESGLLKKDSLHFFKVLTTKSFEDTKLNLQKHSLPLEYTCNLLNYYVKPSTKISLHYVIDLLGLDKIITGINSKKFADDIYFMAGIFPKYFERRIVSKRFYLNYSRNIYCSLSNVQGDTFHKLCKNLPIYVRALNIMRERYLDGYAKKMINSDRTLH